MLNNKRMFILCTLVFIFLCLSNYLSVKPLWVDEQFVLNNIQNSDLSTVLISPLKHAQAFPKIYLLIIKCLSAPFNFHPLALRVLPLVCMVVAFFVWSNVFLQVFTNKWPAYVCILTFISSYRMINYSAELKPYSMDVMIAGLFCLYFLWQNKIKSEKPDYSFMAFTLLLPFALLFSYASLFFFWIISVNFCLIIKKNSKLLILMITYSLQCFFLIVFISLFDLKFLSTDANLFNYWKDNFICTDSVYCFLRSFTEGLRKLSIWWFGDSAFFGKVASFFMPFFLFSLFSIAPRSFLANKFKILDINFLGLVIISELFILGLMKKYPFTGERITLFLAPLVFYMIVNAMSKLKRFTSLYLTVNLSYFIFLGFCLINTFAKFGIL